MNTKLIFKRMSLVSSVIASPLILFSCAKATTDPKETPPSMANQNPIKVDDPTVKPGDSTSPSDNSNQPTLTVLSLTQRDELTSDKKIAIDLKFNNSHLILTNQTILVEIGLLNQTTNYKTIEVKKVEGQQNFLFVFDGLTPNTKYQIKNIQVKEQGLNLKTEIVFQTDPAVVAAEETKILSVTKENKNYGNLKNSAAIKIVFNNIESKFVGKMLAVKLKTKEGQEPFDTETIVELEANKNEYIVEFNNLALQNYTTTNFNLDSIYIIGGKKFTINPLDDIKVETNGEASLNFGISAFSVVSEKTSLTKTVLNSTVENSENAEFKVKIEDVKTKAVFTSDTVSFTSPNTTETKEIVFNGLKVDSYYIVKDIVWISGEPAISKDAQYTDHAIQKFIFKTPKLIFKPSSGSAQANLLDKIDKIVKVKFELSTEIDAEILKIEKMWDDINNVRISGESTNDTFRTKNLRSKLSNSFLTKKIDVQNPKNYLDLTGLLPSESDADNLFNFNNTNANLTLVKQTQKQDLDFFKQQVKYAVYEPSQETEVSKYGKQVFTKLRIYGPSLQHILINKINGLDKLSVSGNESAVKNYTYANIVAGFYALEEVKKRWDLLYLTNQIWLSIYYHYYQYLKATDTEAQIKSLKNIQILLQAMYHGKNAKNLMQQFLKNNDRYQVNNFVEQLKTKNFGTKEPTYFAKLVADTNDENNYANILLYINYLNNNRDLTLAKEEYFEEVNTTLNVNVVYNGILVENSSIDKNNYYNMTFFAKVSKDEKTGKITEIDFNELK